MEFANENVYFTHDRINLKNNKSPFSSSKQSNKKALSDVKNVLHQKSIKNSSHLKVDSCYSDHISKELKSPKQRKKSILKSKEAILNQMDDEFFICNPCLSHTHDDDLSDILPESMRLSKDNVDIFATQWSNHVLVESDDWTNPIDFKEDIFDTLNSSFTGDYPTENSSFLDMLNESYEIMVPQISSEELVT